MSPLLDGGERRNLSVLVLDIAGSTTLANRLDPEDYAELFQGLSRLWQDVLDGYGGHVLKWTGDGLLALFGYPTAHDNDAARAVAAALRIVSVTDQERKVAGDTPDIRIGVHTGLALMSQMGVERHVDIAGDTPAIATRIESLASPNSVFISKSTALRVDREFQLESTGLHGLKGIAEPVEVFRVLGRHEQPIAEVGTELVGRAAEINILNEAWADVSTNGRRAVLVRAAGGIGKSKLVADFADRLAGGGGGDVIVFRCSELLKTTALYPVLRGVRQLIGWSTEAGYEDLTKRLNEEFGGLPIELSADLVAGLFSAPVDPESVSQTLDPSRRRALLLQVLVDWVARRAGSHPLCLVVEDLHWADPTTLEFVQSLVVSESLASSPLLILATCRPEAEVDWVDREGARSLELQALSRDEGQSLISEMASQLPPAVVQRILDRSDLVPLYITELTRAVAAASTTAGVASSSESDVPNTLRDSLMMRLDRLGSGRLLASVAATIGRTFTADLLKLVAAQSDGIDEELDRMVSLGILVRSEGSDRNRQYTFGHTLVREAAYESITRRTRRAWHSRIADAMLISSGATEPAVAAHHLTEATRYPEAVELWSAAAQADFGAAAYDECIANYQRGLELLDRLDPSTALISELPLRLGSGLAHATRFGYTSEVAVASYQRADELAQTLNDPRGFPALLGLWGYYQVRSDIQRRRELAQRAHQLAELSNDPAFRLEGLSALSTTLAFEGASGAALDLIQQGMDLHAGLSGHEMNFVMPQHPVAGFCGVGGPLAFGQGRVDVADEWNRRLVDFANTPVGVLGPFTAAYAHTFGAWMAALKQDYAASAAHAQSAIAIASEHGFLVWIGAAVPHLGIALAQLGDPSTGIQLINDGLAGWSAAGSALFVSYYKHGLGLAYETAGDVPAALSAVTGGIEHSEVHGERFHLAELHRLRGRLLEKAGSILPATEERRRAAEVAAEQGAKVFEFWALFDLFLSGQTREPEATRLAELASELDLQVASVAQARAALGLESSV